MRKHLLPALLGALLVLLAAAAHAAPRYVYLTWNGEDTATRIVVNYQTMPAPAAAPSADGAAPKPSLDALFGKPSIPALPTPPPAPSEGDVPPPSQVFYDVVSRAGQPVSAYAFKATGAAHRIPKLSDGRWVHWIELKDLEPGRAYYFTTGDEAGGYSEERKFRTIPADATSFRFATGGDMGVGPKPASMLKIAASLEPAFCAIGGDLAYANAKTTDLNAPIWDGWMENWTREMVTPEGFTVPMVLAIGNHEVNGFGKPEFAEYWYGYFAQTNRESSEDASYFARRFGKDVLMLALDTGHVTPHAGQADWIREKLSGASDLPLTYALYHVPFYPSHRDFTGIGSAMGRRIWGPIFDEFALDVAFENHDHTYKRTHRIRGGQIDPEGTLYLGDGCFGKGARKVADTLPWFLVRQGSIQHFWLVDVKDGAAEYRAYADDGRVFDVYPEDAAGAAEATAVYEELTRKPDPTPTPAAP